MKATELRGLSTEELTKKETELREDTFRMRFKLSTGELENPAKLKQARKDIARIITILEERKQEAANGK